MKLNINKVEDNMYKCTNSMSISLDKNGYLYDSYCCRAYYSDDKRTPYDQIINHVDEYLKRIFKSFRLKERYSNGYCIRYETDKLCNSLIQPLYMVSQINIGTLTHCNFNCKYCSQKYNRDNKMSIDKEFILTKQIINELRNYPNITKIQLSNSGEVSIYDCSKLFDNIPNNIREIEILSNGSNLNGLLKIKDILDSKNIITQFIITYYSFDSKVRYELTKSTINSFDTILYLSKITDRLMVNFILFEENYKEFEQIYQFCKVNNIKLYILANMFDNKMKTKILELRKQYNDIMFEGIN